MYRLYPPAVVVDLGQDRHPVAMHAVGDAAIPEMTSAWNPWMSFVRPVGGVGRVLFGDDEAGAPCAVMGGVLAQRGGRRSTTWPPPSSGVGPNAVFQPTRRSMAPARCRQQAFLSPGAHSRSALVMPEGFAAGLAALGVQVGVTRIRQRPAAPRCGYRRPESHLLRTAPSAGGHASIRSKGQPSWAAAQFVTDTPRIVCLYRPSCSTSSTQTRRTTTNRGHAGCVGECQVTESAIFRVIDTLNPAHLDVGQTR